jgi:hypothetical protein
MKKLFIALCFTLSLFCLQSQAIATVASTDNKIIYTGDDSTTIFPYNFKIFEDTDLIVTIVTIATGAEEEQTITTDYSVDGVGEAEGGNVTMVTAPASTEQLVIRRVLSMTQGTDLVDNTTFSLEVLEEGFDRAIMITQQLGEALDRTIKAGVASTTEYSLPSPAAGYLLGWNATGDGIENIAVDATSFVEVEVEVEVDPIVKAINGIVKSNGTTISAYKTVAAMDQMIVKGWINFNGTGTIAINDSYNVSSIRDDGTGAYTIFWDTDFANTYYAVAGNCYVAGDNLFVAIKGMTTGSTSIATIKHDGSGVDATTITLIAIGDQ